MSYENRIEKIFISKGIRPFENSSKHNENGSGASGFSVYHGKGKGIILEQPVGRKCAYSNQKEYDYFGRHGKNDGTTTNRTSVGGRD